MKITNAIKTDFNIFDGTLGEIHVLTSANSMMNNATEQPPIQPSSTNLPDVLNRTYEQRMAALAESLKQDRTLEMFYTPDETLADYTPGGRSLADEIALATESGYVGLHDGKLGLRFSVPSLFSPLNFERQVNNLRLLYESYGAEAAQYDAEFETALNGIIDQMLASGGAYINADKEGVADSVRSIFCGESGKYSAGDLSAMIALSKQRLTSAIRFPDSEMELGALLGYEALSIMALRNGGKLSDNAFKTVWDSFQEHVGVMAQRAAESVEHAGRDPFRNKNYTYSPVSKKMIQDSISVMLTALGKEDFNLGIRQALAELKAAYDDHRSAQMDAGFLDQRFMSPSKYGFFAMYAGEEELCFNFELKQTSGYIAQYFGLPDFAIEGKLLSRFDVYT